MSQHIITDADVSLENQTFSLEELARLISAMGVRAWVDHSGGGCATLYAGEPRFNEDAEYRYALIAGPGVMSDIPSASYSGFSVAPDDDGVSDSVSPSEMGLSTLREVAAHMVKMARSLQ